MMTGSQFAGCGWVMTKNPRTGTAKAAATIVAKIAASATRGVPITLNHHATAGSSDRSAVVVKARQAFEKGSR